MSSLHRLALPAVALLVLAATGCDDSSSTSPPPPSPAPSTPAATPTASPTAALGVDAPGLIAFKRYTDATQKTSAIWTVHPDGTGETQVSHPLHGRLDDQPSISADGRRLAFEYCTNGTDLSCHVVVSDIDGSHPQQIHLSCPKGPICDTQAPAWGPDGRLVVNWSWGDGHDAVEHSDLVVVDADGTHPHVVARSKPFDADFNRPVWAPDGTQLAYEYSEARPSGDRRAAIRVVTIATGGTTQITPYSLGAGDGVDWSPDGRWILFHAHDGSQGKAPEDVGLVHPDGSGLRFLTHNLAGGDTVLSSAFSPDGRWVVFGQLVGSEPADLFEVPVAGGPITQLTRTELWESAPEWGPAS